MADKLTFWFTWCHWRCIIIVSIGVRDIHVLCKIKRLLGKQALGQIDTPNSHSTLVNCGLYAQVGGLFLYTTFLKPDNHGLFHCY